MKKSLNIVFLFCLISNLNWSVKVFAEVDQEESTDLDGYSKRGDDDLNQESSSDQSSNELEFNKRNLDEQQPQDEMPPPLPTKKSKKFSLKRNRNQKPSIKSKKSKHLDSPISNAIAGLVGPGKQNKDRNLGPPGEEPSMDVQGQPIGGMKAKEPKFVPNRRKLY